MGLPFLMLINKEKEISDLLLELPNVHAKGDNLVFEHFYDPTPVFGHNKAIREFSDNGFTHDRTMRQIASFDAATWARLCLERPEILRDEKALLKFIKSDEGAPYRTVNRIDTGRSGKAIVK